MNKPARTRWCPAQVPAQRYSVGPVPSQEPGCLVLEVLHSNTGRSCELAWYFLRILRLRQCFAIERSVSSLLYSSGV